MIFFSFCYKCVRAEKNFYYLHGWRSIKTERSDGYVVFYIKDPDFSTEHLTSATCKTLNVSFSFGLFCYLDILIQKSTLGFNFRFSAFFLISYFLNYF